MFRLFHYLLSTTETIHNVFFGSIEQEQLAGIETGLIRWLLDSIRFVFVQKIANNNGIGIEFVCPKIQINLFSRSDSRKPPIISA